MSINVISGLTTIAVVLAVLGVLGLGLTLVSDGHLARGAAVLLSVTGILIWAMAVLYH